MRCADPSGGRRLRASTSPTFSWELSQQHVFLALSTGGRTTAYFGPCLASRRGTPFRCIRDFVSFLWCILVNGRAVVMQDCHICRTGHRPFPEMLKTLCACCTPSGGGCIYAGTQRHGHRDPQEDLGGCQFAILDQLPRCPCLSFQVGAHTQDDAPSGIASCSAAAMLV